MNDNKQIVKLQLDYLQGLIWISDIETGEPFTGIEIIDTDVRVWKLNKKSGSDFLSIMNLILTINPAGSMKHKGTLTEN